MGLRACVVPWGEGGAILEAVLGGGWKVLRACVF